MPRKRISPNAPRCARRYACDCKPHARVTCDAPVLYSAKRDKPTITTPTCLRCGQTMKPVGGSYQALLAPDWESPVLRARVRAAFTAMIAWR